MDNTNAENLAHALEYLMKTLEARLAIHFKTQQPDEEILLPPLAYYEDGSNLSQFIQERQPTFDEYIILLLALSPHVQPGLLDAIIKPFLESSSSFPEIGGTRDNENRVFLPTGETALFILADRNLDKRFEIQKIFSGDHWFARENILRLEAAKPEEPHYSGRLILNPDYVELFTIGYISSPNFSATFPAQEIHTNLDWDELVLSPSVMKQIEEIKHWLVFNQTLSNDWKMKDKLIPGFRALFYGPPGTGKTLTATLLGKFTGLKVFRVDLSTVVSKYIGETEKNLADLFAKAEQYNWILFFDEADTLFCRRTNVKDSHDMYANQQVSYLLQRSATCKCLVICATNYKANIDQAFSRRFNTCIPFLLPNEEERIRIWRNAFPEDIKYEGGVDLPSLIGRFEISGGNIINAVQYACLKSLARGNDKIIYTQDALDGIEKEIAKEGKVYNSQIAVKILSSN